MLVSRIMTKDVKTLSPKDTINDALNLINEHHIRHIPIVEDEEVVGLVTDKDINLALPSILNTHSETTIHHPLEDIMKTRVMFTSPRDFVEELAVDFLEFDVGAICVIQSKKLVGIITQTDIMEAFIEITGMKIPGSIIEIDVLDRPGIVYDIGKILYDLNIVAVSITIFDNTEKEGHKFVVIKINAMNPMFVINKLEEMGYDVVDPLNRG
ncbi:CBS and ACT domain-containing protein [Nosocomiicoccus massiliensis]|uniref:CBS and ACT domain-containing protein n=1 Tax=Nosocomiicoccus massiliensis TaxID=1232430 RepID=UPI00041413F0|nr:CBS and ACT domain-containing protein [Nosocomiicoccus massiliensis]